MRAIAKRLALAAFLACAASAAHSQTLKMMKSLDAPHFDAPPHHLGADRRRHQHDPGHAGGAGLGRPDRHPLPRDILDHQRRRQDLYLQAARRRAVLQRQEVHLRRRGLQLQAVARPGNQGAAEVARRQRQGPARARSLHGRIRAERALLRPDAELRELQHGDPQQGQHREARQGLRHTGDRRHRPLVLRVLEAAHRDGAEAARRLQVGPVDVQEQGPGEVREDGRSPSCRRTPRGSRRC